MTPVAGEEDRDTRLKNEIGMNLGLLSHFRAIGDTISRDAAIAR